MGAVREDMVLTRKKHQDSGDGVERETSHAGLIDRWRGDEATDEAVGSGRGVKI